MEAIDVLKRAGLNIVVNRKSSALFKNDSAPQQVETGSVQSQQPKHTVNPSEYVNSDYETMRMMLGNGNGNNNDPMMNMLPYMLNANNEGKNIDPQIIQTLMMNSMMNGISGLNSTDNK